MAVGLCDEHVGEDRAPRCSLCESLQADYVFHKIALPRVDPGVIENDSHLASSARVVWLGNDFAWAECVRCNFEGPRHFGFLCHGQALIDLEDHVSRHRNISSQTTTTQRSN